VCEDDNVAEPLRPAFQYFVSPAGDDQRGDGSPERPLNTFARALRLVLANHGAPPSHSDALGSGESVEIVCVDAAGATAATGRQLSYFYSPETANDLGNGSESEPWTDLAAAVARLGETHAPGRQAFTPRPGDRVRLTRREVFAASPIERRKHLVDYVAKVVLGAVTASLVLPLLAILAYLLIKAWPALSWAFLVENPQNYMTAGGVWAPLVGTVYLVLISLALATPIGVLAGVYLNEYAGDNWWTRLVNLAVVNLAGVPSIVHALFGVGAFVLFARMGRSVLAASCTLAIMTLPVIIASTREALAAVPQSFREACWNMGASRWQTIRTIVLPNAISGILTGVILQVSRAAGETAPILFTGAVFYVAVPDHGAGSFVPYGLFDRCMALSYHLFTIATQVTGVSESLQYAVAVVLFGLVLAVNMVSIVFRMSLRSRKKW
jgi:phosphate transport system permease protein